MAPLYVLLFQFIVVLLGEITLFFNTEMDGNIMFVKSMFKFLCERMILDEESSDSQYGVIIPNLNLFEISVVLECESTFLSDKILAASHLLLLVFKLNF